MECRKTDENGSVLIVLFTFLGKYLGVPFTMDYDQFNLVTRSLQYFKMTWASPHPSEMVVATQRFPYQCILKVVWYQLQISLALFRKIIIGMFLIGIHI